MYQYLAVIDTEIVHFLPKYPFFLANTSFLQRKYMIRYRRPLRQARLTIKLPLFNTKIPFFLANASFLQRKHTIWYLLRARLTTKLFGSYFVQIKLVALLSTIQYQKFSPTRDWPTRICDSVATENGHCWYSTSFKFWRLRRAQKYFCLFDFFKATYLVILWTFIHKFWHIFKAENLGNFCRFFPRILFIF